jgi:hypothetical protein
VREGVRDDEVTPLLVVTPMPFRDAHPMLVGLGFHGPHGKILTPGEKNILHSIFSVLLLMLMGDFFS